MPPFREPCLPENRKEQSREGKERKGAEAQPTRRTPPPLLRNCEPRKSSLLLNMERPKGSVESWTWREDQKREGEGRGTREGGVGAAGCIRATIWGDLSRYSRERKHNRGAEKCEKIKLIFFFDLGGCVEDKERRARIRMSFVPQPPSPSLLTLSYPSSSYHVR